MPNKIEKFENLHVWKESMNLSIQLYEESKECKDFNLKDQIQRATVSIPSNIAEGFGKKNKQAFYQILISQKLPLVKYVLNYIFAKRSG